MILFNPEGNVLTAARSRIETMMNNDDDAYPIPTSNSFSNTTETTSATPTLPGSSIHANIDNSGSSSNDDRKHVSGNGSNRSHSSSTIPTTTQSQITSAALDAAEEFMAKMDEAFEELESHDNDHDNDIREDAESYPDFDDFENDYSMNGTNGTNGYHHHHHHDLAQDSDEANHTLKMKSISNAKHGIEKQTSNHECNHDDCDYNNINDNINHHLLNNDMDGDDEVEGEDSNSDDATHSTQPCLSSSSSVSPKNFEDEEYDNEAAAATTTAVEYTDTYFTQSHHLPNRSGVLDIVQEEPEEEEAAAEEEEEMEQNNEESNTNWDDHNGFFDFEDEDAEESSIESPLLSPMPVVSNESNGDDKQMQQLPPPATTTTTTPPPQDQPEEQFHSDLSQNEIMENHNDKDLNTSESTENGATNILLSSSIDTIPASNRSSTKVLPTKSSPKLPSSSPTSSSSTTTNNSNMTSPPPSCAKTLTYMVIDQSKTDQLAQSHAEDVLSLTLELQNLRAQLETEQQEHSKTKQYLEKEENQSVQTEMQLQQLKIDMDTMKREYEDELGILQEANESYKAKMEEAEDDAQQALIIAKESDMKVTEMEEYLQKALDEVEQLRASAAMAKSLPMISEQEYHDMNKNIDGESNSQSYETPQRSSGRRPLLTSVSSCSPYHRDRAAFQLGRNILRHVADADDMSTTSNNSSTYEGSTTSNNSYLATLTRRSAEKRQKLRDCMNRSTASTSDIDPTGKEVVCFSSPHSNNGLDLGYGSAFISTIKAVSKTMKQSGKRLNLGGRWFNGPNSSSMKMKKHRSSSSDTDDLDLESLTRNYCRSVEALVSKQREEVKELKQFCGFLEEKLEYK